jgi:hypothetical protein
MHRGERRIARVNGREIIIHVNDHRNAVLISHDWNRGRQVPVRNALHHDDIRITGNCHIYQLSRVVHVTLEKVGSRLGAYDRDIVTASYQRQRRPD